MANLFNTLRQGTATRSENSISLEEWANYFQYNGLTYPTFGNSTLGAKLEEVPHTFPGYVTGLVKANPIIFAAMRMRSQVFSEARFKFRRLEEGRPGAIFGTQDLAILEEPAPGMTTGGLLARAMQDVDISGNFFAARVGKYIYRLRPDWVTIVLGSNAGPDEYASWQYDATAIGYIYKPGGEASGQDEHVFLADEVAHFAPIPDPI